MLKVLDVLRDALDFIVAQTEFPQLGQAEEILERTNEREKVTPKGYCLKETQVEIKDWDSIAWHPTVVWV